MMHAISIFNNSPNLMNFVVNCSSSSKPSDFRFSVHQSIRYLSKSGKLEEAIRLIESLSPDAWSHETYATVLHGCITARSIQHGQKIYGLLLDEKTLFKDPVLQCKLITLFSSCGGLDLARRVLHDVKLVGEVAKPVWVAMSVGYARNGFFREALLVYVELLCCLGEPGNFAFSAALKASMELKSFNVGKGVHAQIVKSSEGADQAVLNALLEFYARCGKYEDTVKLFDTMSERNAVSWNSMISSCIANDNIAESLDMFRKMQEEGFGFTWITLTLILRVCSIVTALLTGKEIHSQILKSRRKPDVQLLNSLMDMYGKCGEVDYCVAVFGLMMTKDVISWNTMLNGYAINGRMEEAIKLFDEMVETGIKPDAITFIVLLSGCSDAGLVEEGQSLFREMENSFGISPSEKHYACLVDILGRVGKIDDALKVVRNMPFKPTRSIWGSLLNSCRLHGNVSIGEYVAKKLFNLEPKNPGNYILLSNIYADAGMWQDMRQIRERMKAGGIKKEVGCSWIQIRGKVHAFVANGGFGFRNSPEYKKLSKELEDAFQEAGYLPDTSVVLHDVDEDTKLTWICGHSERLATIFALIHTVEATPIRVVKNLRVCADCHSWMKVISKVTQRVIILRDTKRFHHFCRGSCSCKDYW